jgi:hypothetical protein
MGGPARGAGIGACISVLVTACCLAGTAFAATKPAKPNLRVSALVPAQTSVLAGARIAVSETTANSGKRTARKSSTAFYLSTDARKDARDLRLGRRSVPALKRRKSSKRSTSLLIPAAQAAGGYRLLACADDARKVREAKEADNCRAAAIAVNRPAPAVTPGGTVTPPVIDPGPTTPAPTTPTPEPTDPGPDPTPTDPGPTTSEQIQAARDAADGVVSLPITGALVTYVKPATGTEEAGFFVQAAQSGPALFVAVDPATLSPVPAVGDRVGFRVTDMATAGSLRKATAIADFARSATGQNVAALEQLVSAQTDLVSAIGSYESELVQLDGTVASAFGAAGAGHVAASIDTAGIAGDPNLKLRLATAVRDAFDLVEACDFTLAAGPMWRFNAQAQPSAYSPTDLTSVSCPAPTVVSALALSATSVRVQFSRALDPDSVSADGSQFTADNGLTFSAAEVSGNLVTLTSSAQTGAASYTVTVAGTVTDTLGADLGTPNSAMFTGFVTIADLLINEINPNITSSADLIELRALSTGTLSGSVLRQTASNPPVVLATLPDVTVTAGDLIVIHLNPSAAAGAAPASETTSKSEYANAMFGANYDGAWDIHGGVTGLTFNHRVVDVVDSGAATLDAVPFVLTTAGSPPASFPSALQAIQAAGNWLPADCGGLPCDYVTVPSAVDVSVQYDGVGTTPTGNSVSRKPGSDSKQKSDWNAAGAQSFGAANP